VMLGREGAAEGLKMMSCISRLIIYAQVIYGDEYGHG